MESWKADDKQIDEVKSEERRCNSAKVRRKKIHPCQMLEKSRNAVFFQRFVCRVSRKVRSLKRRVRSHVVRGEIKNCTPLWREVHFEVKMLKNWRVRSTFCRSDVEKLHAAVARSTFWMYKTRQLRSTFWSWDVEKLHLAVARSAFWSQNVKKLTVSEHFLKFRCRKIGCEKHISKSKCTKCLCFGALFEVQMSKNLSGSKLVSQSISQLVN